MSELLEGLECIWQILRLTNVWLLLSALIVYASLKEGLVEVAVTFGGLFFLLLCFSQDFLSTETLARIFLATATGLFLAFCVWFMRD